MSPQRSIECESLNEELKLLYTNYSKVMHNQMDLTQARDEVREKLHELNKCAYPLLGHHGASVTELCGDMFKDSESYVKWIEECLTCNRVTRVHTVKSLLWYMSKEVWKQSATTQGNLRNATMTTWLHKIQSYKTGKICARCTRNLVKHMVLTKSPHFIPICVQDVKPVIEKALIINNTKYRLCGIVYHGSDHFTCRIIDVSGDIWFHDGITTKEWCEYEGNIDVYNVKAFWKGRQNRTVHIVLYVIDE